MTKRQCYADSRWARKQGKKDPRYFCWNCHRTFTTGKFSQFDSVYYDDICPNCGGIGGTLSELAEAYVDLIRDVYDGRR